MKLVLLADDLIKLLTNELADTEVKEFLTNIIKQKKEEEQKKAKKAKMEATKRMMAKKNANKWKDKMIQIEEE